MFNSKIILPVLSISLLTLAACSSDNRAPTSQDDALETDTTDVPVEDMQETTGFGSIADLGYDLTETGFWPGNDDEKGVKLAALNSAASSLEIGGQQVVSVTSAMVSHDGEAGQSIGGSPVLGAGDHSAYTIDVTLPHADLCAVASFQGLDSQVSNQFGHWAAGQAVCGEHVTLNVLEVTEPGDWQHSQGFPNRVAVTVIFPDGSLLLDWVSEQVTPQYVTGENASEQSLRVCLIETDYPHYSSNGSYFINLGTQAVAMSGYFDGSEQVLTIPSDTAYDFHDGQDVWNDQVKCLESVDGGAIAIGINNTQDAQDFLVISWVGGHASFNILHDYPGNLHFYFN